MFNRHSYVFMYQNADMTTFGKRLRASRKQAGLSQKEVAEKIGTKQPLISELENDEYQTSGFTTRLAYLYKVNARWLAEGKGPKDITVTELLDDEYVADMLRRYSVQDAATQAIVRHLLRDSGEQRPDWMTDGAASAIENARLLVREQLRTHQNGLDVKK